MNASVYEFPVRTIDGREETLARYAGKVLPSIDSSAVKVKLRHYRVP